MLGHLAGYNLSPKILASPSGKIVASIQQELFALIPTMQQPKELTLLPGTNKQHLQDV